MAAVQKSKIKGQAKKCSRGSRKPGAWLITHNARANRPGREIIHRNARQGINGFDVGDVGSAAYRRMLAKRR